MVNQKLKQTLKKLRLYDLNASLIYLLALSHELDPSCVKLPEEDEQKMRTQGIFNRIDSLDIELTVPFTEEERSIDEQISDKLDDYRMIFKGIRRNSMGGKEEVKTKLKKWLLDHPDIDMTRLLDMARKHVETEKYPNNAGYFLYKESNIGGKNVIVSKAEIMLEEMDLEDIVDESFMELR